MEIWPSEEGKILKTDVIIIGMGGMGSSAAFFLAQRGLNVVGIEQFSRGHAMGSSHGETRMIRKAYFEHPDYVPLLQRAFELWRELEFTAAANLLYLPGIVYSLPKESAIYRGLLESARRHQLSLVDDKKTVRDRFGGMFHFPEGHEQIFEPEAGYLKVEPSLLSYLKLAERSGAQFRFNEKVLSWKRAADGFIVTTSNGEYRAPKVVFTCGAWTAKILSQFGLPLKVLRKTMHWYAATRVPDLPCFFFELPEGTIYGFPDTGSGEIKCAEHSGGLPTEADQLDREVHSADYAKTSAFARNHLRMVQSQAADRPTRSDVCLYTMTPDEHFIIDSVPDMPGAYMAAGFSGHGYKFASVVGEILSELVVENRTQHPIEFLRLSRYLTNR